MFKKLNAILIGFLFLLTSFQTMAVLANLPSGIGELGTDGTTVVGNKWEDNFDQYTADSTCGTNGYPNATYNQTSNVFTQFAGSTGNIVTTVGKNNSTALKLTGRTDGNHVREATKAFAKGTNDILMFSYEFKILQNPDVASTTYLAGRSNSIGSAMFNVVLDSGAYKLKKYSTSTYYTYSLNTWYKIVAIQEGAIRTAYILNPDTNEILLSETRTFSDLSTDDFAAVYIGNATGATQTMQVLIDNAALHQYNKTAYVPSILSSSMANGTTDVATGAGSVEVVFDQPITTKAATLYPASNPAGTVACSVTAVATKLNTFTVSWSSSLLTNTNYVLDLSAFANSGGKQAGSTAKIIFTTTEAGIYSLTDSFEDSSKIRTWGAYIDSTGLISCQPGVAGCFSLSNSGYSVKALNIARGTTGAVKLDFREQQSIGENEKLVLNYRINILKNADYTYSATPIGGNNFLQYAGDASSASASKTIATFVHNPNTGEACIMKSGDSYASAVAYSTNKWYNVVWTISRTEQTYNFIDAVTGNLVWQKTLVNPNNAVYQSVYISPFIGGQVDGYMNNNYSVLMDDLTLWRIIPTSAKQKVVLDSAHSSADGVAIDKNGNVMLAFNQPILANEGMFEVYEDAGDCLVPAYSIATVKYTDFCKQTLSFSNLNYYSQYVLDYSALTAVSSAGIKDTTTALFNFSTMADPNPLSVIAKTSSGEISLTGTLTAGTTISFDFYNNTGLSKNVQLIAAFYDNHLYDKLIGVATYDRTVPANQSTVTLPVAETYTNVNKIKIFAWDGISSCAPLMTKYQINEPVTNLNVLMIGNSLSEDASEYLHNMAASDNVDLNVTTKYVGGKTLADHASYLLNDEAVYGTYYNGVLQTNVSKVLRETLTSEQYDVISLQQFGDGYSDAGFAEPLAYLTKEIRKLQPNVKILLYETWSANDATLAVRDNNYKTISEATKKWADIAGTWTADNGLAIEPEGSMGIIPSGRAFNLAQKKYAIFNVAPPSSGDTTQLFAGSTGLYRDYNHASRYGRYLTDAVWYEALVGKLMTNTFTIAAPDGISEAEHTQRIAQLKAIAHQAAKEYDWTR